MPAVFTWLRIDLRRRWRSLAVLALLIALATATVLAAVAGARRQASAPDRLGQRTLPATAAVLANTPGFRWDRVAALPEVERLATFGPSFPVVGLPASAEADVLIGDDVTRTIERPVTIKGRMFDRARTDEVVMTRGFAARFHKSVGDRIEVILPTPAELQAQSGSGPGGALTGPRLTAHIVGVVVSPWYRDQPGEPTGLLLSPAVAARFAPNVVGAQNDPHNANAVNAMIRLRGGSADLPRLRADVARLSHRSDIEIWDLAEQFGRPLQRQASFEAECILAFAAAALIAALLLVGQAVARYAAGAAGDMVSVRALGLTSRQAMAATAGGPLLAAVAGCGAGVTAAYLASPWFPIGSALLVEPSPGRHADWAVFGPGAVLVVVLVTAVAAAATASALRSATRPLSARRSAVAAAAARAGLPVPVVIGSRFAFEVGRGRGAVPVRPALAGAIAGVLGVIAAYTFADAVTDATHHPDRFGQTFDAYAWVGADGQDFLPAAELRAALEARSDVVGIDDARVAAATGPRGVGSVTIYSYSGGAKPLNVVVTAGRMPNTSDEVLLGKQSLAALHTSVGKRVALAGTTSSHTFLVTGSGIVPNGAHNRYADGGWVTDAGYDALFEGHKFHLVYLERAPGAPALRTIVAEIARSHPRLKGVELSPPDPLTELYELRQVRILPLLLAGFLAVLAIAAVGHTLATSVRRRARDLAILRALGLTRPQCRAIVLVQASGLAVAGLAAGIPLGLAVGRTVWRSVATYTPLRYVAPTATLALLLTVPAAILVANLLAAWPSRRATRLRVAQILRAE